MHNKYVVNWSELENSSHIGLYLCVLFLLGEKNMNKYMKVAINEAYKAFKKNEIPVGAVIVKNGKIIAKSRNNRQKYHNLLGHAEINCILKAEKRLKDWRLDDCEMYVTLSPCEMCKIHINECRLNKIYFLLSKNNEQMLEDNFIQTNDCEEITEKYSKLLSSFFEKFRK